MPDEWRGRPLFAVLGRSNLLLRPTFTTSRYLLSAPTFQEVLGNPVKRTTNTVTASEIMLERAEEEFGQLFKIKSCQSASQPVSQSVSQSASQSVSQSDSQSVSQSENQPVS